MKITRTTCPYCGVGCGIEISHETDGTYKVRGDQSHPANLGRLCSKGYALAETLDLDDRLLYPQLNGQRCDWDSALDTVVDRFQKTIAEHGPDSVAFYVSGQLLTEDYYVANKLMKGFIGSANIDTNSRLCMSSSVAGHKRAFGSDTVPGCYEDLETAELVILTGSNTAWCHPVLYQRLVAAKKARPQMKIVVIDPRRTASCDIADLHLPIKPSCDAILFNGLLNWLYQQGHGDSAFVTEHTQGLEEALKTAQWYSPSIEAVAQLCELDIQAITQFYQWYAQIDKTVTLYSQGINQSSSGTDKVNAIINCHLLTGRIGKPAMGPFSVTGQPNAMGGREVGALSNQLAAHMDFQSEHRDLVERFWKTDNLAQHPGLKAIDLFEAVNQGQIKLLWVIATNPAVSMPNAERVRAALDKVDCLVVTDCIARTDTTAYADVLLPALAWGEKDGTVTNSERCITRQKPFLPTPGEARADWWILSEFARRMGYQGFEYQSVHQIFNEHAALSAFENNGRRDFDLTGLIDLDSHQYEDLKPLQWPVKSGHQLSGCKRMFSDHQFFTDNGRANFLTITPSPPAAMIDIEHNLVLNTGRIRDQWHTMTRSGKSPRLNGHISEPFVEIHPQDARLKSVADGELVELESAYGQTILRACVTETQRKGSVFAPIHWNDQYSNRGCIDRVVNPFYDPVSGQPEFKHTPVSLAPYQASWYGFVLSRHPINTDRASYWVKSQKQQLLHYELSGKQSSENWASFARDILPAQSKENDWTEFFDSTQSHYRAARFIEGRLDSCIFIGPDIKLPPRDWLMHLFAKPTLDRMDRMRILAGSPANNQQDCGKIVCSCFNVGINTLSELIKSSKLSTPEQIGERLQAGTNCGSCVPELRDLITQVNLGTG